MYSGNTTTEPHMDSPSQLSCHQPGHWEHSCDPWVLVPWRPNGRRVFSNWSKFLTVDAQHYERDHLLQTLLDSSMTL